MSIGRSPPQCLTSANLVCFTLGYSASKLQFHTHDTESIWGFLKNLMYLNILSDFAVWIFCMYLYVAGVGSIQMIKVS